jgi:hypothetical protein
VNSDGQSHVGFINQAQPLPTQVLVQQCNITLPLRRIRPQPSHHPFSFPPFSFASLQGLRKILCLVFTEKYWQLPPFHHPAVQYCIKKRKKILKRRQDLQGTTETAESKACTFHFMEWGTSVEFLKVSSPFPPLPPPPRYSC